VGRVAGGEQQEEETCEQSDVFHGIKATEASGNAL